MAMMADMEVSFCLCDSRLSGTNQAELRGTIEGLGAKPRCVLLARSGTYRTHPTVGHFCFDLSIIPSETMRTSL